MQQQQQQLVQLDLQQQQQQQQQQQWQQQQLAVHAQRQQLEQQLMAIQQQQLQLDGRQSLPPANRPPALLTPPLLPVSTVVDTVALGINSPSTAAAAVDTGWYTIYPITRLATVARDPTISTFDNTVAPLRVTNIPLRPQLVRKRPAS